MDRYYTLMLVPEKEKKVKSLRIPGLLFRSFAIFSVLFTIVAGILIYDYWKVLKQVYENKRLNLENRQLREQIQVFQMKLNSLDRTLGRIDIFEKKLKVLTGLEEKSLQKNIVPDDKIDGSESTPSYDPQTFFETPKLPENFEEDPEFNKLEKLYEKKIAYNLGIEDTIDFTRYLSDLNTRSFGLAYEYAHFDYTYNYLKKNSESLEARLSKLDEFLLDKESFLKSTPSIMPTRGWITSYYGQRVNPVSKALRMHEGIDIGARFGTDIISPADGVVTFSGKKPGFGNFVQINHGYGIETIFAHARKTIAQKGQKVKRGDLIAKIGSSGSSTGPHVHYEVRINGIAVDPLYYVLYE